MIEDTDFKIEYNEEFLARFACLMEAVNLACQKAEQLGINPDKDSTWIKPLAFQKYIEEREKDMKYQIKNWFNNNPHTHQYSHEQTY